MKYPLDGPIQPCGGEDPEPFDDETQAEIVRNAKLLMEMCRRYPEKVRAMGKDPVKLLRQLEASEAEVLHLQKTVDEAESACLHADADLADLANQVACDLVAFRLALEKELPNLRAKLTAGQLAEVEELLRDWHENREDFLKPLTAEQRRSLGV